MAKPVRIRMGNDTWDPILLPDPHGDREYDVSESVLSRFQAALTEFEEAHDALVRESVPVIRQRHGPRRT